MRTDSRAGRFIAALARTDLDQASAAEALSPASRIVVSLTPTDNTPRVPTRVRARQPQPAGQQLRLMPIGAAIAAIIALATGTAVALIMGASEVLRPGSTSERLDVIKIALAVIAGLGGMVALVVAYRRQRLAEAAQRLAEASEDREWSKLHVERFAKAAEKLGGDSSAVRLAGVYELADLADDWEQGRQTCINVLCAYLRMPSSREPDPEKDPDGHAAWLATREVRTTILRLIGSHLKRDASRSWIGSRFDFSGVTFDMETNFTDVLIADGSVIFTDAVFSGNRLDFSGAEFSGGTVDFHRTKFSRATVNFETATFSGGEVKFAGAKVSGSAVDFDGAEFSGGTVDFHATKFSDSRLSFAAAAFSGGTVDCRDANLFHSKVNFAGAKFSGGDVSFLRADFSGSEVYFDGVEFSRSTVDFDAAEVSTATIRFSRIVDLSHPPRGLPLPPSYVLA